MFGDVDRASVRQPLNRMRSSRLAEALFDRLEDELLDVIREDVRSGCHEMNDFAVTAVHREGDMDSAHHSSSGFRSGPSTTAYSVEGPSPFPSPDAAFG